MIGKKIGPPDRDAPWAQQLRDLVTYFRDPSTQSPDERLLYHGAENLVSEKPELQVAEFEAIVCLSSSAKHPFIHYVFSLRPGEIPTIAQAQDVVRTALKEFGLERHPIIWAVHQDKGHIHLHMALCRIDPETGKATSVARGWDINALHRTVAILEARHGWQKELHATYDVQADGSLVRNERVPDAHMPLSQGAADFEVRTGFKSAERITSEYKSLLLKAGSWLELHESLARHGMAYVLRGDGAAIAVHFDDKTEHVPPSTVDRSISRKSMEKRLGPYVPASSATTIHPHTHELVIPKSSSEVAGEQARRVKYEAERELMQRRHQREMAAAEAAIAAKGKEKIRGINRKALAARHKRELRALTRQYRIPRHPAQRSFTRDFVIPVPQNFEPRQAFEIEPMARAIPVRDDFRTHWMIERPCSTSTIEEDRAALTTAPGLIQIHDIRDRWTIRAAMRMVRNADISIDLPDNTPELILAEAARANVTVKGVHATDVRSRIEELESVRKASDRSHLMKLIRRLDREVQADRYRISCLRRHKCNENRHWIGGRDGLTLDGIRGRYEELEDAEDLTILPMSSRHRYIVLSELSADDLRRLEQSGIAPAVCLRTSDDTHDVIIRVPAQRQGALQFLERKVLWAVERYLARKFNARMWSLGWAAGARFGRAFRTEDAVVISALAFGKVCTLTARLFLRAYRALERQSIRQQEAVLAEMRRKRRTKLWQRPPQDDHEPRKSAFDAYVRHRHDLTHHLVTSGREFMSDSWIDARIAVRMRATGHDALLIRAALTELSPSPLDPERIVTVAFGERGRQEMARYSHLHRVWRNVDTGKLPRKKLISDAVWKQAAYLMADVKQKRATPQEPQLRLEQAIKSKLNADAARLSSLAERLSVQKQQIAKRKAEVEAGEQFLLTGRAALERQSKRLHDAITISVMRAQFRLMTVSTRLMTQKAAILAASNPPVTGIEVSMQAQAVAHEPEAGSAFDDFRNGDQSDGLSHTQDERVFFDEDVGGTPPSTEPLAPPLGEWGPILLDDEIDLQVQPAAKTLSPAMQSEHEASLPPNDLMGDVFEKKPAPLSTPAPAPDTGTRIEAAGGVGCTPTADAIPASGSTVPAVAEDTAPPPYVAPQPEATAVANAMQEAPKASETAGVIGISGNVSEDIDGSQLSEKPKVIETNQSGQDADQHPGIEGDSGADALTIFNEDQGLSEGARAPSVATGIVESAVPPHEAESMPEPSVSATPSKPSEATGQNSPSGSSAGRSRGDRKQLIAGQLDRMLTKLFPAGFDGHTKGRCIRWALSEAYREGDGSKYLDALKASMHRSSSTNPNEIADKIALIQQHGILILNFIKKFSEDDDRSDIMKLLKSDTNLQSVTGNAKAPTATKGRAKSNSKGIGD